MNFLPKSVSTYGQQFDSLLVYITVVTMILFVIAQVFLFYTFIKYRKKDGAKASYLNGTGWKQLRWIILPLILVVGLDFSIDLKNVSLWNRIKVDMPTADYHIRITGQQFAWVFTYPGADGILGTEDDFKVMNELHVPMNKNIVFELEAKDVIHSFWVPQLRLKQDAVPGRNITGWFNVTEAGEYEIACAEICGAGHTNMAARLFSHSDEEFQAWVQKQTQPAADGAQLDGKTVATAKGCLACHSVDGPKIVGPTYKGLWGKKEKVVTAGKDREVLVDEEYIKKSILVPEADVVKDYPNIMPKIPMTDDEIKAVIEFIKGLK